MAWPHWSILLSHHPPDEYDRCVSCRWLLVCRRCLFTYSSTLLSLLFTAGPQPLSDAWDPLFLALAVPATLDFVLEQTGALPYHPSRVAVTSVMLGLPLGRAIGRFLENHLDPKVWAFLLVFGLPALGALLWRVFRGRSSPHPDD